MTARRRKNESFSEFLERRTQSDMSRKVRVSLHYRADCRVTLYMNGKRCMTGDHDAMRSAGQHLVDEGKARWGRKTFTHRKGDS